MTSFREFYESISASGGSSLDFEKGDQKKPMKPANTYPKRKTLFKSAEHARVVPDSAPKEVKPGAIAAAFHKGMKMRANMVQSVTPKEPAKKKK